MDKTKMQDAIIGIVKSLDCKKLDWTWRFLSHLTVEEKA